MADRICEESKKRITTSIRTSVKCAITLTSLVLSERMIVLFVCITETPIEMAVMLSKIFILLAGHSSETYSYLADMEPIKKKEVAASIIQVPGCYQFIQGQYGRIQFVLVWRQKISLCFAHTHFLSPFLPFLLLIHSQLCGTLCVTSSGFCSWLH